MIQGTYQYPYLFTDLDESLCIRFDVSIVACGGEWWIDDVHVVAVNARCPSLDEACEWQVVFWNSLIRECDAEIDRNFAEVFGERKPVLNILDRFMARLLGTRGVAT